MTDQAIRAEISDLRRKLADHESHIRDLNYKFDYPYSTSSKLAEKIAEGEKTIRELEQELEFPSIGKTRASRKIESLERKFERLTLFAPILLVYAMIICIIISSCVAKN